MCARRRQATGGQDAPLRAPAALRGLDDQKMAGICNLLQSGMANPKNVNVGTTANAEYDQPAEVETPFTTLFLKKSEFSGTNCARTLN